MPDYPLVPKSNRYLEAGQFSRSSWSRVGALVRDLGDWGDARRGRAARET